MTEDNMKTKNDINLAVYLFKDKRANCYVAYCPSLNLCGYDHTQRAAQKDFLYVLDEYLNEQTENGTLVEDLIQHGWTITENEVIAPTFHAMYRAKGSQLRDILTDESVDYRRYNVPCPTIL